MIMIICYSNVRRPFQLSIIPCDNSFRFPVVGDNALFNKTPLTCGCRMNAAIVVLEASYQAPLSPAQISSWKYGKICKNGVINSPCLFFRRFRAHKLFTLSP